jgi:hypothetical protein
MVEYCTISLSTLSSSGVVLRSTPEYWEYFVVLLVLSTQVESRERSTILLLYHYFAYSEYRVQRYRHQQLSVELEQFANHRRQINKK